VLHRPRHRSRTLGQAHAHDRQQRIVRDHPHAELGLRYDRRVYKAGFATTQAAYEEAVIPLFDTLDWLEKQLADRRFLFGDSLTEADIRLFTTLIRFDAVYAGHFKCNIRRIADYPNLSAYTRDIYQWSGIAATVNFEHIRRHYYESHRSINPTGIVPVGPLLDFTAPHRRERLAAATQHRQ
jgi:glutathionyl-hydroquinone reductase